jgi:hypothetical protein
MYLSKSDFTHAEDCLAKLYFKKHNYPSSTENAFMESLARVGHIVGYLAKVTFDGGTEISMNGGTDGAVKATLDWIESHESGILYEATFAAEGRTARVDVLRKRGNLLEVIEVKSSGYDATLTDKDAKKQESSLDSKLIDLAFQTALVERAMPEYRIEPMLCLLDKNAVNRLEGLYGRFRVEELASLGRFKATEVHYDGDLDELRAQELLTLWPCRSQVDARKQKAWDLSQTMVVALERVDDFEAFRSPRKMACAKCPYRVMHEPDERNGFAKCWGADAHIQPHIFNIRRDRWTSEVLNPLVADGMARLDQVPPELMYSKQGPRVYGIPHLQLQGVREHVGEKVAELFGELTYPLFFIDFEAIRAAVPYHKGMSPYRSIVLFQWSCHKIAKSGAPVEHFEYLNTEPSMPNDRFIAALREVLGSSGTVLTWSSYENTQLRNYLEELDVDGQTDHGLATWLRSVLKDKDGGWRQLDLHDDVVKKHYYHHLMANRTSIKAVLPAILSEKQPQANNELLQSVGLYKAAEGQGLVDPYELLPGVKDGTQAMTAYDEMLYGNGAKDLDFRSKKAKELLAYCELDTLSMVLIFNYLKQKIDEV